MMWTRIKLDFFIFFKLLEVQEKRVEAEMKSYTSSDPNDKKRSYRFDTVGLFKESNHYVVWDFNFLGHLSNEIICQLH